MKALNAADQWIHIAEGTISSEPESNCSVSSATHPGKCSRPAKDRVVIRGKVSDTHCIFCVYVQVHTCIEGQRITSSFPSETLCSLRSRVSFGHESCQLG